MIREGIIPIKRNPHELPVEELTIDELHEQLAELRNLNLGTLSQEEKEVEIEEGDQEFQMNESRITAISEELRKRKILRKAA